jgi:uncharacterized Zn finger protein
MAIVKDGDGILIHGHYSKELIFEFNKNKAADKSAYEELHTIWREAKDLPAYFKAPVVSQRK